MKKALRLLALSIALVSVCFGDDVTDKLRKAAKQGDARAQFMLGDAHYFGTGVPKDFEESVKWYRRAADQGNADAQFNLGDAHYFGTGVPTDFEEGVKWYRKAAEQGHVSAQNNLGAAYNNGEGWNPTNGHRGPLVIT
ncbi:MAG: sel1 repeat family protein [Mycobacteriaceae bacterium]|nr:sel1 repeat family protein [Mycobacteriaceae bacterium]